MQILKLIIVIVISYLLGSLDFGIIVSKYLYHDDVRNHGSGNAGTTNVLRTFGKKRAALTIAGDVLKGTLAVVIAKMIFSAATLNYVADTGFFAPSVMREIAMYAAVAGAVIGHMHPVFFGFKGGKGVATGFGAMLRATPVVAVIVLIVFAVVVRITRIVSLASILACVAFFVSTLAIQIAQGTFGQGARIIQLIAAFILPGSVVYAHRSNIKRLLNGTEYKFGQKK